MRGVAEIVDVSQRAMVAGAVDYLNRILAADPVAVSAIFLSRVPCNAVLADDPTCQVRVERKEGVGISFSVSAFGMLNGMFGVDAAGWGYIEAETEGDRILRFRVRG